MNSDYLLYLNQNNNQPVTSHEELKIVVIVTTYNTEKFLSVCLDSIINNTHKNLEIILVDDESTDNTIDVCNSYVQKDSRIKLVEQPNSGVSVARNLGIEIALQGDGYAIHFVDGDDYVDENFYAQLLANMYKTDSEIAVASAFNERFNFILSPNPLYHVGLAGKLSLIEGWLKGVWSLLFRLDFLRNHPSLRFDPEIAFGEDLLLVVAATSYAKGGVGAPGALYYYRFNPNSVTTQVDDGKAQARADLSFLIGDRLDELAIVHNFNEEVWYNHKQRNYVLQGKYYQSFLDSIHANASRNQKEENTEDVEQSLQVADHVEENNENGLEGQENLHNDKHIIKRIIKKIYIKLHTIFIFNAYTRTEVKKILEETSLFSK